jgi:hypothetical protein
MRSLEIPERTAFFAGLGIGKAIRRQPAQPELQPAMLRLCEVCEIDAL